MSTFAEALRTRRSVRRFKAEPVPEALVAELLELAFWAPTPMNRQDGHVVVVTSPEVRRQVTEAVDEGWGELLARDGAVSEALRGYAANFSAFREAPVLLAFYARRVPAFLRHLAPDDAERLAGDATASAMEAFACMLAARTRGLGTCFFSGPVAVQDRLKPILAPPKGRDLVGLVALGWPAEAPTAPARRPAPGRETWIRAPQGGA